MLLIFILEFWITYGSATLLHMGLYVPGRVVVLSVGRSPFSPRRPSPGAPFHGLWAGCLHCHFINMQGFLRVQPLEI